MSTAPNAEQHRPKDRQEFMAAAVRLRQDQNLKPDDIAVILKLSTNAVRELLYQADHGHELFGSSIPSDQRRERP